MKFDEAAWRTSSRSQGANACVEVAVTPTAVGVRDSKDRGAGHFTVDPTAWSAFTTQVKAGVYDA